MIAFALAAILGAPTAPTYCPALGSSFIAERKLEYFDEEGTADYSRLERITFKVAQHDSRGYVFLRGETKLLAEFLGTEKLPVEPDIKPATFEEMRTSDGQIKTRQTFSVDAWLEGDLAEFVSPKLPPEWKAETKWSWSGQPGGDADLAPLRRDAKIDSVDPKLRRAKITISFSEENDKDQLQATSHLVVRTDDGTVESAVVDVPRFWIPGGDGEILRLKMTWTRKPAAASLQ